MRLDDRDEAARHLETSVGLRPSRQELDADRLRIGQLEDRLTPGDDVALLERHMGLSSQMLAVVFVGSELIVGDDHPPLAE